MSSLSQPSARFLGDDGAPDPITRAALARVSDATSYTRALVALCSSRLLMPIVASGDETMTQDPDRHAEMAAVKLVDESGVHLLGFTGIDSMQAWQNEARPVLCTLDQLAATVKESGANKLLLDVAGPHPLVIEGATLEQFARGFALVEFEDGFAWVKPAK